MTLSNHVTSPSVSLWVMPLGKTPPYLDPQSQEALYEVDVSGMRLSFSFNLHQSEQDEGRNPGPSLGMKTCHDPHQTSI